MPSRITPDVEVDNKAKLEYTAYKMLFISLCCW